MNDGHTNYFLIFSELASKAFAGSEAFKAMYFGKGIGG